MANCTGLPLIAQNSLVKDFKVRPAEPVNRPTPQLEASGPGPVTGPPGPYGPSLLVAELGVQGLAR